MRYRVEESGAFAFVIDQDDIGAAESLFNGCPAGEIVDQVLADCIQLEMGVVAAVAGVIGDPPQVWRWLIDEQTQLLEARQLCQQMMHRVE